MTQKGILFSGGPLDGQQLMVPDESMHQYKFRRLKDTGFREADQIKTEECIYHKTSLKVGACEIFVWQDDLPITLPSP